MIINKHVQYINKSHVCQEKYNNTKYKIITTFNNLKGISSFLKYTLIIYFT